MTRPVVVTKTGMVLNRPSNAKNTSSRGEIGETHGLMRHLVDSGRRVVFVGRQRGGLPPGVEHVDCDVSGIDEFTTVAGQLECYRHVVKAVRELDPYAWVDMIGPSGSRYRLSPERLSGYLMCMRYAGPQLEAMGACGVPRVTVITDARCYPKEIEMVETWPTLRPVAVFSQSARSFERVVGGCRFSVEEVWCDAHGWWLPEWEATRQVEMLVDRPYRVCMLSHCHIREGYRQEGRAEAFRALFGRGPWPDDWRVFGEGWDAMPEYAALTRPAVPTSEYYDVILATAIGPMITPRPHGWPFTAKALQHAVCGAAPVFYGHGQPFTYDPEYRVIPEDSQWRVSQPEQLQWLARFVTDGEIAEHCAQVTERMRPTWEQIDRCLEQLERGQTPEGCGGYYRV